MMISLHPEVIVKCHSLINLGAFLCIFSIYEFKRVSDVVDNLNINRPSSLFYDFHLRIQNDKIRTHRLYPPLRKRRT